MAKQSGGKDTEKLRKSTVSYKGVSQMPRENEVKELKLYVGKIFLSVKFFVLIEASLYN